MLRAVAPVGLLAGALTLAGCGDDDAASLPTSTIAPESYVTRAPATTTTTIPIEDIPPGGVAPQEQEYEIESGDYLAAIAERYEVSIDEIVQYNDWPEGSGHNLYPGEVIKIPPNAIVPDDGDSADETSTTPLAGSDLVEDSESDGSEPESSTAQTAGDNCSAGSYELEDGDFPLGVAEKFDVTLDALNDANATTAGYDTFYPGLEVVIPAKSNCE